jgi:hypothetical protein
MPTSVETVLPGNIAVHASAYLEWDAEHEGITGLAESRAGDLEAANGQINPPRRSPWELAQACPPKFKGGAFICPLCMSHLCKGRGGVRPNPSKTCGKATRR